MIRTVRLLLQKNIGQQSLTSEELTTVLYELKAVINPRALTNLSSSPGVLTPAHFLAGKSITGLPDHKQDIDISSSQAPLPKIWIYRAQLIEHFRGRWRKEYLLSLCSVHHASVQAPDYDNLKQGDLVILCEDKIPLQLWKTARIIERHRGRD
uniref:Putative transposable element n=1 Tax=Rhipicephalus microplus TaxID=6941 RepID=A0A6M2D239_RHIMP